MSRLVFEAEITPGTTTTETIEGAAEVLERLASTSPVGTGS